MKVAWLLEAIAYAVLASGVVAVNWHRKRTRVAGAALLVFSLVSSATVLLHWPFEIRVIREILGATIMAGIAGILFAERDARRPYQIVIALALLDVGFCGAISMHGGQAVQFRYLFGWVVNPVFIGMCACIAAPGVRDAYLDWIASIDRVRRMDSSAPDLDWAIRNLDR